MEQLYESLIETIDYRNVQYLEVMKCGYNLSTIFYT